jgi:hypothetical protein
LPAVTDRFVDSGNSTELAGCGGEAVPVHKRCYRVGKKRTILAGQYKSGLLEFRVVVVHTCVILKRGDVDMRNRPRNSQWRTLRLELRDGSFGVYYQIEKREQKVRDDIDGRMPGGAETASGGMKIKVVSNPAPTIT